MPVRSQLRQIALFASLLLLLVFGLFVINQVSVAYQLASGVHPAFGQVVLWGLTALLLGLLAAPVVLYFRLPAPLRPVGDTFDREAFLRRVGQRLAHHPTFRRDASYDFAQSADVVRGLAQLDAQANLATRRTAKAIFLTTAISQNGKLDALAVLAAQTRLVWEIAHVYHQRPTLRDFVRLYGQVGLAALIATEVEDLDLTEQLEPVIGAVVQGSAVTSLPVVGSAARVVADSLLEGTVNAYLTLRVGVIARRYCGTPEAFEPRRARRAAFAEAAGMLRGLVAESSGELATAVVRAGRKAGRSTVASGGAAVVRAGVRVRTGWENLTRRRSSNEAPAAPENSAT